MSDWDVIVVGAGPAGSASAIGCARAGLRTLLLERSTFPRTRPGETLHPGVEPILQTLGVAELVLARDFPRHAGHWVTWGGPPRFEPFGGDRNGPWRGFQALRTEFDALLLRGAREAGAEVLQPCRALKIERQDGRATGVATSAGQLNARFVIDAAGGGHWISRQLGQHRCNRSPRLIARYGYAEGDRTERDDAPSLVADDKGWTWAARVAPRIYAWTRLDVAPRETADAASRPAELQALCPLGTERGVDVTWRIAAEPAGPGYFAVGDAAAVLDPASSHGILKALMSGTLAARRIEQVLREGVPEAAAISDYNQWVRAFFTHDVRRLSAMYCVFPYWQYRYGSSR